jgi:hypothetical protein
LKTLASILLICLFLLGACAPASGNLTPSSVSPGGSQTALTDTPAPPTFTPSPTQPPTPGVLARLGLAGSASTRPEVDAGSTVRLVLHLEPVWLSLLLDANGSPNGVSYRPWDTADLAQVQVCLDLKGPCQPAGKGLPYQPELPLELAVDWLGPHPVWVGVSVQDGTGAFVQIFDSNTYQAAPSAGLQLTLSSRLNDRTPLAAQPAPVQTAAAATRSAFPLRGSVLIEDGRCCAGGVEGSTIQLHVTFSAQSTRGAVTEMRVTNSGGCLKDAPTLDAPWEPFVTAKTYPASLGINWIGWYINVQYRDAAGNLSPVYCDDISLEGSPPTP